MKALIPILLALGLLNSSFGQNSLIGYYSSNKADAGFFVTSIQLNIDSTFKYEFRGDLFYDSGTGKYTVDKKALVRLRFDPAISDPNQALLAALQSPAASNRNERFLYKRNKLFFYNTKGDLVKKHFLKKRHGQLIFRGEINSPN